MSNRWLMCVRTLTVVLVLCLLFTLVGCSTATNETNESEEQESAADASDADNVSEPDGEDADNVSEEETTNESEQESEEDIEPEEEDDPMLQADIGMTLQQESEPEDQDETFVSADTISGTYQGEIEVQDYGTISIELYADIAPVTVANFINLANSGFYDGLTFHRIIEGFVLQGGAPAVYGTVDPIYGEFESNGWENTLSHTRGVLSMARMSGQPDSATSQFFIMHGDATYLDGDYAAFGQVTDGMDVVDAIVADAEPTDNNGTIPSDQQPVIVSIRIDLPEVEDENG